MITAKVTCNNKSAVWGTGEHQSVTLGFCPDYQDGRNKAWAASTPALNLTMTVRADVATHFEMGDHYTLTFTPEAAGE